MSARAGWVIRYYLFWVAFFAVARVVFLVYHSPSSLRLGWPTLLGTVLHGARMDLAVAAYATAIPALVIALSVVTPPVATKRLLQVVSAAALILSSVVTVVDLEVYRGWGFRLDSTPLRYFALPRELIASAGSAEVVVPVAILVCLMMASGIVLSRLVLRRLVLSQARPVAAIPLILLTGALVVPARGGLQWWPLTQSSVYFSEQQFANQAAINVTWNFFSSIQRRPYDRRNPYTFLKLEEAARVVDSARLSNPAPEQPEGGAVLAGTNQPNIILIIWESLTAKVVEPLGGIAGVTPELNALVREGILFDRFYASGDRTDRGLAAILSGIPALGQFAIINEPSKTARLPVLSRDLKSEGYMTSFYYGGQLDFANLRAYLANGGFDNVAGKDEFPWSERGSAWGVHDHIVLARVLRDASSLREPFFTTVLTLSSHEPYRVPEPAAFNGEDELSRFASSHRYADRSVGQFIRQAKLQPWWANTVVIIVGDHGHRLPARGVAGTRSSPDDFRIPMLWLGGALSVRDTVIRSVGSQVDLAATLLAQLRIPSDGYRWGQDLLAPRTTPFAYYAFNDGFGVVDGRGAVVFDNLARRVVYREGDAGDQEARLGMALLQLSYQDYLDR